MADDETRKYPSGYRFDPFDHELINDYLKPKVLGRQLPCNIIKNREVYGPSSNPWQVFDPNDHSWLISPHIKPTQKYMFVFAKLSKLSNSYTSKNTSKKAGCGTWVGKTSRKKIRDGKGNVIGESRYLVFEIDEIDSAVGVGCDLNKVGFYTMHEYSLSGINEGLNSADSIVVCKITYDSSKQSTRALKSGTKTAECVSVCTSEAPIKEENNNNFEGSGTVKTENPTVIDGDGGALKSGTKTADCVSVSTSEAPIKVENNNNFEGSGTVKTENPTVIDGGGVCENLDERRTLTSKNLTAIDSGVGDNLEESRNLISESLVLRNSDVGDWYATPDQYNNGLQELIVFGGGYCFDDLGGENFYLDDLGGFDTDCTDWITTCLDSNQEEEPVENDSFSKSGKRKFEANENSCRTKKMCL